MPQRRPRTFVYIDGFNLFYGCLRKTPHKWLDLSKLCSSLLPHDDIQAIKYFTAEVTGRPNDQDHPIRQQLYFRALRTLPQVSIILGHFLTHRVRMPIYKSNPLKWVMVEKTQEKGSDVNLAAHLLHDGFQGLYDCAALITNDSDLMEPVRIVREVLKLPIGIINPHEHHSKELQKNATFVKRIRETHLRNSQFPNPMCDSNGSFGKPGDW